jgi:hypothetical protein
LSCKTAETYPIESVRRKEVSDQRLSARRGIASVVMLNSHTFQLSFRTAPDPSGVAGLEIAKLSNLDIGWNLSWRRANVRQYSGNLGACIYSQETGGSARNYEIFRRDVIDNSVCHLDTRNRQKIRWPGTRSAQSARYGQITPWHIPCSNERTILALLN